MMLPRIQRTSARVVPIRRYCQRCLSTFWLYSPSRATHCVRCQQHVAHLPRSRWASLATHLAQAAVALAALFVVVMLALALAGALPK